MVSRAKRNVGLTAAIVGATLIVAGALTQQTIFYTFGAVSLLVAIASYTNARLALFLGSVLGSAAFLFGLAYLINEMISGPLFAEKGSDPSKMNALMFFVVFGLPGAAFALSTKFGYRKKPEEESKTG